MEKIEKDKFLQEVKNLGDKNAGWIRVNDIHNLIVSKFSEKYIPINIDMLLCSSDTNKFTLDKVKSTICGECGKRETHDDLHFHGEWWRYKIQVTLGYLYQKLSQQSQDTIVEYTLKKPNCYYPDEFSYRNQVDISFVLEKNKTPIHEISAEVRRALKIKFVSKDKRSFYMTENTPVWILEEQFTRILSKPLNQLSFHNLFLPNT